jgi:hypothetical protein
MNQLVDVAADAGWMAPGERTNLLGNKAPRNTVSDFSPRFYLAHDGRGLDTDTPKILWGIVDQELIIWCKDTRSQGRVLWAAPYMTMSVRHLGMRSKIGRQSF